MIDMLNKMCQLFLYLSLQHKNLCLLILYEICKRQYLLFNTYQVSISAKNINSWGKVDNYIYIFFTHFVISFYISCLLTDNLMVIHLCEDSIIEAQFLPALMKLQSQSFIKELYIILYYRAFQFLVILYEILCIVLSWFCHRFVINLSSSCHCSVNVLLLICQCYVIVMSLFCLCSLIVLSLFCHCSVIVTSLLCQAQQGIPKICLRYAHYMTKICPGYAHSMSKKCARCVHNMSKICQRFAKDMPKL